LVIFKELRFQYQIWKNYPGYRSIDRRFRGLYRWNSPYRIAANFFRNRGEDPYTYGETPLPTMEKIALWAGISNKDLVLELGCGAGRTSIFLNHIFGCSVLGVDQITHFIQTAKKFETETLHFANLDFLQVPLDEVNFIYLCGTCLDDDFIEVLQDHFRALKPGSIVISVSYPFDNEGLFEIKRRENFSFLWGDSEVFLSVRK